MAATNWTLMIHGGAGAMARGALEAADEVAARGGLEAALNVGAAVLADGGRALDAVEAAVCALEDDPAFNAGRGAVLGYDGGHELDAAIMNGADRSAGSVAQTRFTRNPVCLARAVLNHSPHVLLAGQGADAFALSQGLEQVANEWFSTPERVRQLAELKAREAAGMGGAFDSAMKYGTVGAVAVDSAGHVAAATSTGGLTGKRWGRIGDSPLIGAGTWADDRSCAVSATGAGEAFIRVGVGHEIAARMRFSGEDAATAAAVVLAEVNAIGGVGGVIVVAPDGDAAWRFTTPGMYRARCDGSGHRTVAIFGDDD